MVQYCLNRISKKLEISSVWLYIGFVFLGASGLTYNFNYPFLMAQTCRAYVGFFYGLCLAVLMKNVPLHKNKYMMGGCIFFLTIACTIWFGVQSAMQNDMRFLLVFLIWPCVLLIFKSPMVEKLFRNPRWEILAGIAFNTFMWHADMLIVANTIYAIVPHAGFYTRRGMLAFTMACFGVGTLSYFILDKPITDAISKICRKK